MRVQRADTEAGKGWYVGPWNSDLAVPIGYANEGVNEPHVHASTFEVYLVARGTSVIRVERESIELAAGDVIVVEPGEAHTFLENSADYHHFVVCAPGTGEQLNGPDKSPVPPERLGL